MDSVLLYLLQSSAVLGLSCLFYFFIFRKETNYQVNRIYLLAAGFISLLIPFAKFESEVIVNYSEMQVWLPAVNMNPASKNNAAAHSLTDYLTIIYFSVTVILLLRFLFNLVKIGQLIIGNVRKNNKSGGSIIINSNFSPFSFFNNIFLPDDQIVESDLNYIIAHELVHIKKFHSVDKIFMELIAIAQWFNPLVYLYKKELTAQHEFEADSEMVRRGSDIREYIKSLLEYSVFVPGSVVTNSYNSLLKRRLEMIGKIPKTNIPLIKTTLSLLFLLTVFISTGIVNGGLSLPMQEKQAENEKVYTFTDQMPQFPGGDDKLLEYLDKNIHYPEIAKRAGIEGRVIVTFVVNKSGKVTNVKVRKGIGAGCDEEAIRLISNMGDWKPGKSKGKVVNVRMSIPIVFKLQG